MKICWRNNNLGKFLNVSQVLNNGMISMYGIVIVILWLKQGFTMSLNICYKNVYVKAMIKFLQLDTFSWMTPNLPLILHSNMKH